MPRYCRRSAFTLIELLTVIAIITLLIGILTPSLGRARDEAKKAAILAQINAMSTGMEMFQNDESKYPASNAADYGGDTAAAMTKWVVGTPADPLQGANLAVDALLGRDLLGYDPKGNDSTTSPPYVRWSPDNSRRKPYVDPGGITTSKRGKNVEDGFGILPPEATPLLTRADGAEIYAPVFLDKFERPILYYRAYRNATSRTPILARGYSGNLPSPPGAYNGRDNFVFTNYPNGNSDLPPTTQHHEINQASADLTDDGDWGQNNFADFIRSIRSSTTDPSNPDRVLFMRPVNPDKFILLSPGKDGIYGTLDDAGNFAVKSEDR